MGDCGSGAQQDTTGVSRLRPGGRLRHFICLWWTAQPWKSAHKVNTGLMSKSSGFERTIKETIQSCTGLSLISFYTLLCCCPGLDYNMVSTQYNRLTFELHGTCRHTVHDGCLGQSWCFEWDRGLYYTTLTLWRHSEPTYTHTLDVLTEWNETHLSVKTQTNIFWTNSLIPLCKHQFNNLKERSLYWPSGLQHFMLTNFTHSTIVLKDSSSR